MSAVELSIGKKLRVVDVENKCSGIATISYVNEETGTVDVIHEGNGSEECNVSISRLSDIFPFEVDSSLVETDASLLKEYGNKLFSAKDFTAASQLYLKALQLLVSGEILSIGSQILVLISNEYQDGMVSNVDVSQGKVDVELDDNRDITVLEADTIRLCSLKEDLKLQRSLNLNIAKCSHKKALKGWAVRYSSIAIAIVNFVLKNCTLTPDEQKDLLKAKADSHYFRGKVLLEASRPHNAEKDCYYLASVDKAKANQLQTEILRFKEKRQKDNRKLAKEIAKWVDTAVTMSQNPKASSEQDLDLEADADEDDVQEMLSKEPLQTEISKPEPQPHSQPPGKPSHHHSATSSGFNNSIYLVSVAVMIAAIVIFYFSNQPAA